MQLESIARHLDAYSREGRLVCDAAGVIQWVDRGAERLLGVRPGMPLAALAACGAEPALAALCRRGVRTPVTSAELRLCVDDRVLLTECTAVPIQGRIALLISVPAQTTSARDQEIKGHVISNMIHDLRTGIHSIMGLCSLLLEDLEHPLSKEQQLQVGFIRKAIDAVSSLTTDLFDLTRLDTGAVKPRSQPVSTAELFESLRAMLEPLLASAANTQASDSPVTVILEEPAAELTLDTDPIRLLQILRLLIANAIRFTDRGEVRVWAWQEPESEPEDDHAHVCFAVRDTGIGIAPEDQERIFDAFVQLEPERCAKGCGLGLALARKLARLLGGDIAVDSQLGQGAAFIVHLPVKHTHGHPHGHPHGHTHGHAHGHAHSMDASARRAGNA